MVMRTMRENTKWIMLFTAITFAALMVFEWGMDLTGRSGAQFTGGEIGRVNGEPISYDEFSAVYRRLYDQQQQMASGPIGAALNRQIEDAAWEQVVVQRLIAQELRRRGIVVTDDEVRQAARYEPPPELRENPLFQTDGQFDLAKYQSFLSDPARADPQLLLDLEAYYRDAIPRSKLYFQTTAGYFVTDDELWRMWRDTRDAVTVRYVVFDPEALVSDAAVTISDAEIAQFYQANREDFLRPARAQVKYVTLDRQPNAADTAAALARAQRLRAELTGGSDFAEVARRESADSASARDGGKLEVRKGQMAPALEQAAFAQPIGRVGEPVLTQFGYHLIRTESRAADSATVRHILVPIALSPEHEDELLDVADSLDTLTEVLNLDEAGRQLGLEVRESELVPGLAFLPGVGLADDGATWAFDEAVPGEVSRLYETPTSYYAIELVVREDERTLTQQEATETIRATLRVQKKLARAREIVRGAVDRIRAGESLEQVAAEYSVEVKHAGPFTRTDFVPGLGRVNAAIGTAFGLRPGQTSGVVEAEQTLYIMRVESRQDADRAAWEAQKDEQRRRITPVLLEQRWNQYVASLRLNARIVDNRKELLRRTPADTVAN